MVHLQHGWYPDFGKAGDVHVVLEEDPSMDLPGMEPQARSIESRLREAKRLRDEGVITEEEYRTKRETILRGL